MDSILQIKIGRKIYEGKVTYEEGDIIEAVFTEEIEVAAGEPVPCLLTRNFEAIHNFEGVVIAREEHRLILFHSPTIIEFREQRRRYPRFDINVKGWIRQVHMDDDSIRYRDIMIDIKNVGLGGFAFECEKQLPMNEIFIFYTELYGPKQTGGILQARVQVLHEKARKPYLYGCKIIDITAKYLHTLRRYLLERQLEELKVTQRP